MAETKTVRRGSLKSPDSHPDHEHHSDHHVRFDQHSIHDSFEEDNSVTYEKVDVNTINVHLGFLQLQHKYLLELKIPCNIFTQPNVSLVPDEKIHPNLFCRLSEFNGKEVESAEFYNAKVEFVTHKEKFVKEILNVVNEKSGEKFKFIFIARVLGEGKGTPMLRNGIHIVGHTGTDDSDHSDWKGFAHSHHS